MKIISMLLEKPPSCPQLYLHSTADKVIPYCSMESFMEIQRTKGMDEQEEIRNDAKVASLTKNYSLYIPDLLFFGASMTDSPDRSPEIQAECLAAGLRKLGLESCTVVGFSHGGMVAFKMAEMYPDFFFLLKE
ncbi:hypothetical protein QQ045_019012 [Rhodiola kirilowii]